MIKPDFNRFQQIEAHFDQWAKLILASPRFLDKPFCPKKLITLNQPFLDFFQAINFYIKDLSFLEQKRYPQKPGTLSDAHFRTDHFAPLFAKIGWKTTWFDRKYWNKFSV